jgi:hypothetical protein
MLFSFRLTSRILKEPAYCEKSEGALLQTEDSSAARPILASDIGLSIHCGVIFVFPRILFISCDLGSILPEREARNCGSYEAWKLPKN